MKMSLKKMDTPIFKRLILLLILIASGVAYASRPEPTNRTIATKAEAIYSDNIFVGFKTSYVKFEIEMTEIYDKFYCRYIEPYVADMLSENDTIFVISQFDSVMLGDGVESIYIQLSNPINKYRPKTVGILKGKDFEIVDKYNPLFPDDYIGFQNADWAVEQFHLCSTMIVGKPTSIINLFCSSPLKRIGNDADNHSMNIYRVVKIGDKITEYASLSCNAQTKWRFSGRLNRVVPLSCGMLIFKKTIVRPPETVEKTKLL